MSGSWPFDEIEYDDVVYTLVPDRDKLSNEEIVAKMMTRIGDLRAEYDKKVTAHEKARIDMESALERLDHAQEALKRRIAEFEHQAPHESRRGKELRR